MEKALAHPRCYRGREEGKGACQLLAERALEHESRAGNYYDSPLHTVISLNRAAGVAERLGFRRSTVQAHVPTTLLHRTLLHILAPAASSPRLLPDLPFVPFTLVAQVYS